MNISKSLRMLIIEDDKYCRLNLKEILNPYGIIEEAEDINSARIKINADYYDIIITDIELGNGSGVDLIPIIVNKGTYCIVVSAYEGDHIIEQVYSLGAKHFLSKFKIREQLPLYIHKFLQTRSARFEQFMKNEFITQDEELISDLRNLCELNLKGSSLFISGPTGTGKSLLGKLIHFYNSPDSPFVHLNCSEIPDNLIESELFGHEKGSFTGADNKKDGKLKLAHNGTLFLDEIGTMSLAMQQKLLKAIDEKTFYPVGSNTPIKSNFTLITATCEDMMSKIKRKEFREDLFFRLNGYKLNLKPLSERTSDIELLFKKFQINSPRRYFIKPEAMEHLKKYSWPGNTRELSKVSDAFSQSQTGIIDLFTVKKMLNSSSLKTLPAIESSNEEYIKNYGLKAFIAHAEKMAVESAMKRNNGKITACIKELQISTSAFYRILQEQQYQL